MYMVGNFIIWIRTGIYSPHAPRDMHMGGQVQLAHLVMGVYKARAWAGHQVGK